jgi:hypothetical protein
MINERGMNALAAQMAAQARADELAPVYASCPCTQHGVQLMSARMTVREQAAIAEQAMIMLIEEPWIGC